MEIERILNNVQHDLAAGKSCIKVSWGTRYFTTVVGDVTTSYTVDSLRELLDRRGELPEDRKAELLSKITTIDQETKGRVDGVGALLLRKIWSIWRGLSAKVADLFPRRAASNIATPAVRSGGRTADQILDNILSAKESLDSQSRGALLHLAIAAKKRSVNELNSQFVQLINDRIVEDDSVPAAVRNTVHVPLIDILADLWYPDHILGDARFSESIKELADSSRPVLVMMAQSGGEIPIRTLLRSSLALQLASLNSGGCTIEELYPDIDDGITFLETVTQSHCSLKLNRLDLSGYRNQLLPNTFNKIINSPAVGGLTHIDLCKCQGLTDASIEALAISNKVYPLKYLNISGCSNLGDRSLEAIATSKQLVNLEHLRLAGCYRVTDFSVQSIVNSDGMSHLEHLDFSSCEQLTDASIEELAASSKMAHLTYLDISGCHRLRDAAMQAIAASKHMENLRHLDIACCALLTDASIQALATSEHVVHLEHLNLTSCHKLTNASVLDIVGSKNMENLKLLRLGGCSITDVSVQALATSEHMSHLEHLDLMASYRLTDASVLALAGSKHLPNLNHLNLTLCTELTDASVEAIATSQHMGSLRDLKLRHCSLLTDVSIEKLATSEHMSGLESLNLGSCYGLTDASVWAIAGSKLMANLRLLDLSSCVKLTDASVEALAASKNMAQLENLCMLGCPKITAP